MKTFFMLCFCGITLAGEPLCKDTNAFADLETCERIAAELKKEEPGLTYYCEERNDADREKLIGKNKNGKAPS